MEIKYNWNPINWNIVEYKTDKHCYMYQNYRPYDTVSYSGKMKANVLLVDRNAPIIVKDIFEAENLIENNERI